MNNHREITEEDIDRIENWYIDSTMVNFYGVRSTIKYHSKYIWVFTHPKGIGGSAEYERHIYDYYDENKQAYHQWIEEC